MLSEKQLVNRLKNGETQALQLIMELYQNYVYTLALQMVKTHEAAEELTQDVFVKVYKKINSYEERAKFTTWLYTITYRTCLNYLEKKKIVYNLSELSVESETQDETAFSKEFDTIDFNDKLESEEKQKILWNSIDALPLQQGIIITLYYLQQFSIREISELMQVPVNTVKTHLHRGRNSMRDTLLKNFSKEELS